MSATETLARVITQTMPNCSEPSSWAPPLDAAMTRFRINDGKEQIAAFLGQIAVESQDMNRLVENLNYSAARLMAVWPKRFPAVAIADQYAHNPAKLANFVYGGRMGNSAPEDGYRYRGRGLKQLTGKDNYAACGKGLGLDLVNNPDMLTTKQGAALSAGWYWASRTLSTLADGSLAGFEEITRRINGGLTGLDMRVAYWKRARSALGLT